MYTLLVKRSAERDLCRLPPVMFQRLNKRILALRAEPYPPGARKLRGALTGWRFRVGDYRVLYQVDDDTQTVTVVRVKHRREAYR